MLGVITPHRGARLLVAAMRLRGAGGVGSGNFGHAGRPGEVGGSAASSSSVLPNGTIDFETFSRGMSPELASVFRSTAQHLFDQSFRDESNVHETLNYLDVATGTLVFPESMHGDIDGVNVPEYQQRAVDLYPDPSNLVPMHTHPSGSAFSPADFRLVLAERLGGAIVIGKDGAVYELKMRRQPKQSEVESLHEDLNILLTLGRSEAMQETDQYARVKYNLPLGRLNRAAIIAAHPDVDAQHTLYWIAATDNAWRTFAEDHKDILSYRRTPGKTAVPQLKAASWRYAQAREGGFRLDDSDTTSVYALDGAPRRKMRGAGGVGSGNFGHAGRPGEVGGSAADSASSVVPSGIVDAIRKADGGFTYHAVTGQSPTSGYALSLHSDREQVIAAADANVVTLATYAAKNWDLLREPGNYFGAWHNPVDGKVYLDVSTVVADPSEAERLGADAHQYAYYDLANGTSISIQGRRYEHPKAAAAFDWVSTHAGGHHRTGPPLDWTRAYRKRGKRRKKDPRYAGGVGSGNFGHAGRPGEVGGSAPIGTDPYGGVSTWTPQDGGTLYHGTEKDPQRTAVYGYIEDRPIFLTTEYDEAAGYARQVHRYGAKQTPQAHVIQFEADPGKVLDVDDVVAEALESGDDPETAAIDAGKKAHVDFVTYTHPSNIEGKETEQTVIIALRPRKTLAYNKAWSVATHRALARRTETALHAAADAHVARLSVALRYAFAVTKKQLRPLLASRKLTSYDEALETLRAALDDVVAKQILPMVVSGGRVAATMLRTAEDFRAAKRGTRIDFSFAAENQHAIDWADRHAAELIDGITETSREAISNATAEYLETGDWDAFTDAVLDAVGDESRADLIARHEPMLAASEGQRLAWDQAVDEGLLTGKERPIWIVVGDDKVCPICLGLDGKTRDLDGVYVSDDGDEYDGPPAHVRCLPGDSLVTPIGRVAASSERWFDGDLIVILTASGHELSCTANHPILTNKGWIAAHLLKIGDHVICLRRCDWETQIHNNHQDMPACIQDIARFADDPVASCGRRVPLSSKDFHGDGKDSEIAIIRTNGLLRNRSDSPFNKQIAEQSFASIQSTYALNSECVCDLLGLSADGTFRSRVGGSSLLSLSLFGHAQPLQNLALTLVTWCHALQQQDSTNGSSTCIASVSDLIFGLSGEIETDDIIVRQCGVLTPFKEALAGQPSTNSTLRQFQPNDDRRYTELRSELRFVRAREIETSQLVSVRRRQFSGHVFNLETESQLYIGNGIVSSNCRCTEGLS